MPTWQATFLAMASFTGQHPAGQNLIWNGICAFVLGGLAIVAWTKQNRLPDRLDKLLLWAFLFGFATEAFFLGLKFLGQLELLQTELFLVEISLAEYGMRNFAATFLMGGFIGYLSKRIRKAKTCLLYTSPSPRDRTRSRMPSSA